VPRAVDARRLQRPAPSANRASCRPRAGRVMSARPGAALVCGVRSTTSPPPYGGQRRTPGGLTPGAVTATRRSCAVAARVRHGCGRSCAGARARRVEKRFRHHSGGQNGGAESWAAAQLSAPPFWPRKHVRQSQRGGGNAEKQAGAARGRPSLAREAAARGAAGRGLPAAARRRAGGGRPRGRSRGGRAGPPGGGAGQGGAAGGRGAGRPEATG